MMTMNELVDLRMQQQIAHEIYRQQIMQRIPDPFPPMLPIPIPRHVIMPPRITLPGADVTLQNDELWKQFHQIGTEMIITKSGSAHHRTIGHFGASNVSHRPSDAHIKNDALTKSAACHPLPDRYYEQFHTFNKHFDRTTDKQQTAMYLTFQMKQSKMQRPTRPSDQETVARQRPTRASFLWPPIQFGRMFPSMRLSLSGLEDESNYCVLLEMVPIGDCRYKFSGSQWMPAGGAEPQSPQRMYLHPDSPASGVHWQAQPILFNKVKLTNNTLDSNGHIVLASMHKYQPRIHVIRTTDLTQIPWAPQQAFVFPETEFVAVTAYQNDRITKLKIDNNPFAKGFRESGQSRSKRKMSSSPSDEDSEHQQQKQPQPQQQQQQQIQSPQQSGRQQGAIQLQKQQQLHQTHSHSQRRVVSPTISSVALPVTSDSGSSICSDKAANTNSDDIAYVDVDIVTDADTNDDGGPQIKRMRSKESAVSIASTPLDEMIVNAHMGSSDCRPPLPIPEETSLPPTLFEWSQLPEQTANIAFANGGHHSSFMQHLQQNMQSMLRPSLVDLACTYFGRSQPIYTQHIYPTHTVAEDQNVSVAMPPTAEHFPHSVYIESTLSTRANEILPHSLLHDTEESEPQPQNVGNDEGNTDSDLQSNATQILQMGNIMSQSPPKRKGFSISAILGGGS